MKVLLGLGLARGLAVLLLPALLFSTMFSLKDGKDLPAHRFAALLAVRTFHTEIVLFLAAYLFVFNNANDIAYIALYFLITFHWKLFKNECVLSYVESKIVEPGYRLGEDPSRHDVPILTAIVHSMFLVTVVIVALRVSRSYAFVNGTLALLIIVLAFVSWRKTPHLNGFLHPVTFYP
jgi:hypothetical protein